MEETNYKETGKNIPIKMNELIDFIYDRLDNYDKIIGDDDALSEYNPYKEPLIYNTTDGKTIQIPKQVQEHAVNEWLTVEKKRRDRAYDGPPGYSMGSAFNSGAESKEITYHPPTQNDNTNKDIGLVESDEYNIHPMRQESQESQELQNDSNYNKEQVIIEKTSYKLTYLLLVVVVLLAYYLWKTGKLRFR